MVSVFAVTAFAADCKVNDSDISGEYAGGCVNGLASGKGVAKGKHEYSGSFLNGNKHGFGVFTQSDGLVYTGKFRDDSAKGQGVIVWPGGIRYEGEFSNDQPNGFGKKIFSKGVEQGWFNNNKFILSCTSPQNCKQEQASREAQERRDQAARDEQYRRDAPARQARQMCEAQKQTCKAGCGPITYWNGRSYVDNPNYNSCDYRCSQISCN